MSGTSEGPVAPAGTAPDAGRPTVTECEDAGYAQPGPVDYRAAFRVAALAMAVVDPLGLIVRANDAMGPLLGADPAALSGQRAADLLGLASDHRTWHAYREVLAGRRTLFHCTRGLKHPDGRALWAEITVVPLTAAVTPGVPLTAAVTPGVLLTVTDISGRRELQQRLRHLRMHDPVTGLPNRALFFERLSAALDPLPYQGEPLPAHGRIGLCYLDLDGFKAVNDTLGHRTGDLLLAAVAGRLDDCAEAVVRPQDGQGHDGSGQDGPNRGNPNRGNPNHNSPSHESPSHDDPSEDDPSEDDLGQEDSPHRDGGHLVARLGGDEFAILVEDSAGPHQLTELARSVVTALQQPFELAGQRLSVSASIGVVERESAGTSATALMQAADTTLYWAKADGGARWTLFDPERNAHRMTRQALSSTLRPAIERGEFTLEYQPLVGMADEIVRGVEALVRWNHPQFGTLAPTRFVAIAEEDGSIVQLGRWILRTACRQARDWQLAHPAEPPLFISVNVAVRQVWDSDLVTDVAEILAETGLAPGLLQLELTESAVMGSAGRPLRALQELSDMGVRIAIDDFGTGYSNLAYLSRLPVSVLKLDGSFVRGFRYEDGGHPSPADETIVEAMVQLAHRLGLTVTAECVETSGQAERLRRIGCDTGQGWLYSRAVAPERIAELISPGVFRLDQAG